MTELKKQQLYKLWTKQGMPTYIQCFKMADLEACEKLEAEFPGHMKKVKKELKEAMKYWGTKSKYLDKK